jgi:hypothetical protein
MTAPNPTAATIVANSLVPVRRRRQPDLDPDSIGPGPGVFVFFGGETRTDQQLDKAKVSGGGHRLRSVRSLKAFALVNPADGKNARQFIWLKCRLDSVVAGKRSSERG